MFEKNVGGLDRALRFVVGGALLLLGPAFLKRRSRTAGFSALFLAVGLLASAIAQRCTINRLLGIDTCPADRT